MLPILYLPRDLAQIEALRAKLSLKPLLVHGLDDEDPNPHKGEESKFQIVRRILRDVQLRGDPAVLEYTKKFDNPPPTTPQPAAIAAQPGSAHGEPAGGQAGGMGVTTAQIQAAVRAASPKFLNALDVAIANIRTYQTAMLPKTPPPIPAPGGGENSLLGVKYTPLQRVGLYVPGGAAAYPSSVLHTAIPAQVAGVKELVLCSPMRNGQVAPAVLVAAHRLGITEIYAIGGAQAIAAMAFGTQTIRPVDKIVGPGNAFVQLAKKELFGIVDIDSFAGPSEVIVLADDTADPAQVAAELLAQAEHAPGSCLLITPSEPLAKQVQAQLEQQLTTLSRETLTREALKFASALIVTPDHTAALDLVDRFAPEHLQITTAASLADAARIMHAGAIFIGPCTAVAAGDYLAGPSHVLPTSGTARFFSGLSAESFRKRTSLIMFDQAALDKLGQTIVDFATVEGFDAHAKSVITRAQH